MLSVGLINSRNPSCAGRQLAQEFAPLCRQLSDKEMMPVALPSGAGEAGDKAEIGSAVEDPDCPHRPLLRACGERPTRSGASDHCYELRAHHLP
jgi:hypothetical protein